MFKKLLTTFIALVAVLALGSCKEKEENRTYVADGSYTAFKTEVYNGNPQVTSVTVVIKDDKIESYYIDCTQGHKVTAVDSDDQTGAEFNEKSKKELGYEYKMHYYSLGATSMDDYKEKLAAEGKLEWFEQANLIEAAWLKNGESSVTTNDSNVINNVTGVTIKNGSYIELAKEAVELAKAGTVKAYATYEDDLIFATGKVDKDGNLSNVVLDTLQGQFTGGTWSFKDSTKQELGYEYRMHYYSLGATSIDDYKEKLAESGDLEWFEQAELIVNKFLADGTFTVGSDSKITGIAKVTINDNCYLEVLTSLKACVSK